MKQSVIDLSFDELIATNLSQVLSLLHLFSHVFTPFPKSAKSKEPCSCSATLPFSTPSYRTVSQSTHWRETHDHTLSPLVRSAVEATGRRKRKATFV